VFREAQGQGYFTHLWKNFHKTLHDIERSPSSVVFLGLIMYRAVVTSGANDLVILSDRFLGCSKVVFRTFCLCNVEFLDDGNSEF